MSDFNIERFLKSSKEKIINKRFVVKASVLNTGAFEPSILIVVRDLLENNFMMRYFKTEDEANQFIQLLLHT
jgi:hypothetical protein